ncbi:MAG: tRNA (adenosine(37)-N6)-dimethylallyltransferase MiaA [Bacteroidales bacterium]|jgi:tRNA dimethylallyltransferase|nr:tRNA (adenosine(37)-N6)-dimethylallyltransferase MiaA [Bacteroidales bacterium]
MKNILIVLLGPTGVGKTDAAVEAALHLGCEIISSDSRQFYREMKTGTAVPSDDQLALVRHHFIRFISARQYYSSSLYERDVLDLLPSLFRKNRIALMTGGSGMYIDAVCEGIDEIPDTDSAVRMKYNTLYREEGIEGIRMALRMVDPEHYAKVDLKNPKRIIRALEVCDTTGRPYSSFLGKQKRERDFRVLKIGLTRSRDELYKRINQRVDKMMEDGLEEEARHLYELRHLNALNTVGYRELFDYFDGKISREKAIELIKRNTRRYAKRQITWWARDSEIKWFSAESQGNITDFIERLLIHLDYRTG